MTRIDFYSLDAGSRGDRFLLTCRLVERIHQPGPGGQSGPGDRPTPRIHIQLSDPVQVERLDRLLWTFEDQSFLPHGRLGQIDPDLTPILIGAEPLSDHDQVLINLDLAVPPAFARFERLCEPLDTDPAVTTAGRERYRFYRDRGYPLHHHQIHL